MTILTFAGQNT